MRAAASTAAILGLAASANAVKWCTKSAPELATCTQMAAAMKAAKAVNTWECVQEDNADACLAAVEAKVADVVSVGASVVFAASEKFGAQLLAGETLGADGAIEYYALAVVRADQDVSKGWESLKGLTSCHTGYKKTSGWSMPVGTLYAEGVLPGLNRDGDKPNDIEAIEAFFGESCAPSAAEVPTDGLDGICSACDGDCSQTDAEKFQDYPGSFECLKAKAGDVAFTKQGVIPAAEAANYLLMCKDGKTMPLSDFAECNLGKVPSHSVITRGDVEASVLASWKADILAAAKTKPFRDLFFTPAGVNADDHIFEAAATGLESVPPSARQHIGTAYEAFRSLSALNALPANAAAAPGPGAQTTAKWCVDSDEALAKCESMLEPLNAGASLTWSCVKLADSDACIDSLETGIVDAISVGASVAVKAAQKYGSQIVISEDYGTEGSNKATEYYALAIVKKDLDVSGGWESLRGLKSCHTGYRKTSGWTMPIGTLLNNGVMSAAGNTDPSVPNDIYAVKQFFSATCAPSQDEPPVDGVTGICSACAGDCTWTDREPYQDYPGSFACLKAGGGDVAFTRQGEVPAAEEADYKLICADGRELPLADFETCNLARVPSHVVLTGGARPASFVVTMAADLTAAAGSEEFSALFFKDEKSNPDGLIFSEDAKGLTPATSSSVVALVGDAYFAYKAITDSDASTERAAPKAGGKSNSDKNAAIALGVILAVVLLAAAGLIFRMKKSNKRLSKELSKAQGNQQDWGATHASKA